jgi:isopenicillin N synthase-like dioxygenase
MTERTHSSQSIPVVDVADYRAGGDRRRKFAQSVGDSLAEIGFFSVIGHDIDGGCMDRAYAAARAFFALPGPRKEVYERASSRGQRGFTSFGREHAKDSRYPDLKEFYQVGRTDVPDEHPVHAPYGANLWPDAEVPGFREVMSDLYQRLDRLGGLLLEACAVYLGEPADRFASMTAGSDTILRIIHYPPVLPGTPPGSIRAAAHEDINLITLLLGATADGLELLRRDGSWMPVRATPEQIVVDAGDMLQNLTNGLFRSTTHRVVNGERSSEARFSMPCFVHPRKEIDLTPLASCVLRTGGQSRFPAITAGTYLEQRLAEIGLA